MTRARSIALPSASPDSLPSTSSLPVHATLRSRRAALPPLLPVAFACALAFGAGPSFAQPAGNQLPVVNGGVAPINATIGAPAGTVANPVMNITQTGQRGLIEWQSFSIGAGARVNIVQPGAQSVLVNRVTPGANAPASEIYGQLSSNGRVFLVNPAGITFGAGAQVNVGSLVATTLDLAPSMTDNQYAGLLNPATRTIPLAGTAATDLVVSSGATLRADPAGGGSIVLVGNRGVTHNGLVEAVRGRIALGAGAAANLVLPASDSGFIDLVVTGATPGGAVEVGGGSALHADGGSIVIGSSAGGVNRVETLTIDGEVNAGSTTGAGGSVRIDASDAGAVTLGREGTISVESTAAGQRGGEVRVLGGSVVLDDRSILTAVPVAGAAAIDASGVAGGGSITLGGDATRAVSIGNNVLVAADATGTGDGGRITLQANFQDAATAPVARVNFGVTEIYGALSARGGIDGGNGGQIATSGRALTTSLDDSSLGSLAASVNASARAADGVAGTWTLDPFNVTITDAASTSVTGRWEPTAPGANIAASDISFALDGGTSIEINTGSAASGSQAGTITFSNATITRNNPGAATTLTFRAHDAITFDNAAIVAADDAPLNVNLFTDLDGNGTGYALLTDTRILTGGGNLVIAGGADPATGAARSNGQLAAITLASTSISTTGAAGDGSVTIRGTALAGSGDAGVLLTGSNITAGNTTVRGTADTGSGVVLQGSTLGSATGTIDIRGVATRSTDGSTAVIGTELVDTTINLGTGNLLLAGRGDDAGRSFDGTAATGLQYSNLRITTDGATGGNIQLAGEAANSTGAGISFRDLDTGGLDVRAGTSTNIPTLANVSLGAISAQGLAMELGLADDPAAASVLTSGVVNFRPLGVAADGQLVERVDAAITIGTGPATGFVVSPGQLASASFQAGSGFVVGSSAHSGAITVQDGALTGLQEVSLSLQNQGAGSAGVSLGGGTEVGNLGILTAGNVTQTGSFAVAGDLILQGGATVALTAPGNTVGGTVSFAGPATLDLLVDGALTVGTASTAATGYDAATGTPAPILLASSSATTQATLRSTNGAVNATHGIALGGGALDLVSTTSVSVAPAAALSGAAVRAWAPVVDWGAAGRTNYYGCTFPTCALSAIQVPTAGLNALFAVRPVLNVVARPATGTSGTAPPAFGFDSSGFVNGDAPDIALTGTPATSATATSPAGTYTIDQGTLTSPTGYLINYTGASFTLAQGAVSGVLNDMSRETVRSAYLAEFRSDLYGRNLALPFVCTAQSVIRDSVASEAGADPLAAEWGKVRQQPQLSGCLEVSDGGQCAAF